MTEPTASPVDHAGAPTRRGRPRSEATLDRDAAVLRLLADGPRTTAQLASALDLPKPGIAYLALYRLRHHGANAAEPLVTRVAGSRSTYELTDAGRRAVASSPAG